MFRFPRRKIILLNYLQLTFVEIEIVNTVEI